MACTRAFVCTCTYMCTLVRTALAEAFSGCSQNIARFPPYEYASSIPRVLISLHVDFQGSCRLLWHAVMAKQFPFPLLFARLCRVLSILTAFLRKRRYRSLQRMPNCSKPFFFRVWVCSFAWEVPFLTACVRRRCHQGFRRMQPRQSKHS